VQALRDAGYVEEENINLTIELTQLNADIIIADGTNPSLAAKKVSSTIPIVMMTSTDPVANGLVVSLAHPGGNITGLIWVSRESERTCCGIPGTRIF
jgi:putative ABC transport system substrate-binding protein